MVGTGDTEKLLEEKVSWDWAVQQFEKLIKFAARKRVTDYPTDNCVSAEDLYQDGMIQLYNSWLDYGHKGKEEFSYLFKASLWRRVARCGGIQRDHIDLSDVSEYVEDTESVNVIEKMYVDNGIKYLRSTLNNQIAVELMDELIEPSDKTLFEVWADIKRKEMLKSQGKHVNVPKDNTVRMKHIIRALGITNKQYDNAIREIKDKARLAFDTSLAKGILSWS